MCGTPGYVAPEILSEEPYDHRCDYWSLGVILFVLCCGKAPFFHEDKYELFDRIKEGKFNFDSQPQWKNISNDLKNFIK